MVVLRFISRFVEVASSLMKIHRTVNALLVLIVFSIATLASARAADTPASGWNPSAFQGESTLQIMTTEPDVGEHWSKLWLVVIDNQLYVRLGDRSYGRVQRNTTTPYLKLKVAGQEFDKVKLEEMPDMKDKVAVAMADKYFMDILIRHESHPMVARLTPETAPPPTASR
jgi:hypothetical protein